MDCLRSFTITIDQVLNFTTAGTNVRVWNAATGNAWTVLDNVSESRFVVQGFKNINIFGVKMQGYCSPIITGTSGAIVEDFGFQMVFGGQSPILGGDFTVNTYGAVISNQPINLTKFNSKFEFSTPIQSANFIEIGTFFAQGFGYQTLNNISLSINASFIVYYDFEG